MTLRQGRLSTPAVVRGYSVWEVRGWAQVTWAVEEVRLVLVCVGVVGDMRVRWCG
jgi:hypothetical protein